MKTQIFNEQNGVFSWRKAGTAMIYFLFAFLVIGYAIKENWKEIPASYMAVFYMVIAFYFAKEGVRKLGGAKLKTSVTVDDVQPDPNNPGPR